MTDIKLVTDTTAKAVAKAASLPAVDLEPATIQSITTATPTTAMVVLDSDPSATPTEVGILTGIPLVAGSRVELLSVPPSSKWVIGVIGGVTLAKAEVYRAGAYTQVTAGREIVPFDTTVYDPSGSITLGTSGSFRCPLAGEYLINAGVIVAPVSGDLYALSVYKNGSEARQLDRDTPSNTGLITLSGMTCMQCAANDVLSIEFDPVTATNTVFTVGKAYTYASFILISSP
jgi:hypothetical protein